MTMFPDPPDPTRAAGLARLDDFLPGAGAPYARGRNFDNPDAVSGLSPWLRHRLLTEAEVLAAVRDAHGPDRAEKFIAEVFWRTYFKGWLERRPSVWRHYRSEVARGRDRLATEAGLRRAWEQACLGQTGIDCYDNWARELVETGYLTNHARMWTASIWCFTLGLPWALGADFFLRHLMDGDPASNTLGWRWVAGLQTPGKVYAARAENIARYTEGRFDPRGQLNESPEPVDGPDNPKAGPVPEGDDRPAGGRIGLLLHEDDLTADHIPGAAGVAVLRTDAPRSPWATGARAAAFTEGALADAAALHGDAPILARGEIAAWAAEFDAVVTPWPPQGHAAETLDALEVPVVRLLRDYDAACWPHAAKGFFVFKKAIPDLLAPL